MAADSEFTPLVQRLGCLRGIGTLTGFALAVELGDWHRFTGNTIGSFVGLVPSEYSSGPVTGPGLDHQDRQHPRPPTAGRGRLAPPRPLPVGKTMRDRWELATPAARARGDAGNRRLQRPLEHLHAPAASARRSPTSPSPASWPAGAGPWPCSRTSPATSTCFVDQPTGGSSAWSDPRNSYEQPTLTGRRRSTPRHAVRSCRTAPSCGNQPAHISLTARRTTRQPPADRRKHEAPARTQPGGRLTLPLDRRPLHISSPGAVGHLVPRHGHRRLPEASPEDHRRTRTREHAGEVRARTRRARHQAAHPPVRRPASVDA